jgi:ribosomal protein S1
VVVLEADPSGRRIRLSRKAVLDAVERDEAREYRERESAAELEKTGGFGSLADTLRKALDKR